MENNLAQNATFIGGHRRSGTTLLLNLLESHPQLNVFPADSGFFYAYFPIYESLKYSNQDKVNRIIDFCYGNLKEEINGVDVDSELKFSFDTLYQKFRKMASEGDYTSKAMLLAMVFAYRETFYPGNKTHERWVEKTSSSEIYANYIFGWFPRARFIHLIRDPRDNYASLKSGWEVKYKNRNDDPRRLLQSMIDRGRLGMELAGYNLKRYGKRRYLVLKFEELVCNPEEKMRKLCDFLGIKYNNCLFKPTVAGRLWRGNNFQGAQFNTPSNANVGRWRERITDEEAKVIEYYFREIMQQFGYLPQFDRDECIDAAAEHYKWHNYAQLYTG